MRWALVLAVAWAVLVPAGAQAWREPTYEERLELGDALDYPACYVGTISTVDQRWASVWVPDPDCPAYVDTVIVLHNDPAEGGWVGMDVYDREDRVCGPDTPMAVGQDLRWDDEAACGPASRDIFAIDLYRLRVEPRSLVQGAHGAFKGLRWKGWGGARAFARGWLVYGDAYTRRTLRARVRIVLSKHGVCGRRRVYFKRRVEVVHARDRHWTRYLTGAHTWACPGLGSVKHQPIGSQHVIGPASRQRPGPWPPKGKLR